MTTRKLPETPASVLQALDRAQAAAKQRGLRPGVYRKRRSQEASSGDPSAYGPGNARDPKTLGSTLSALLTARQWQGEVETGSVVDHWPEIAGAAIAENTEVVKFESGVLSLRCREAWRLELLGQKQALLRRCDEVLGPRKVLDIEIARTSSKTFKRGAWSAPGRGVRDTYS